MIELKIPPLVGTFRAKQLQVGVMSAEEAWEIHYRHMADFDEVVFSQFKARLADHRRLVRRDLHTAAHEAAALAHDRLLFPRQPTNERGELVFDLHPAKRLLREDLRTQRHVGLTPSQGIPIDARRLPSITNEPATSRYLAIGRRVRVYKNYLSTNTKTPRPKLKG
jgi:hypothetical protein